MTTQPQGNTSVKHGEDVTLSAAAIGPEPLSYKWKKDGVKISDTKCKGANTDTLTIICFSKVDRGNYTCTVNGGHQSVESKPAALELGNVFICLVCIHCDPCV